MRSTLLQAWFSLLFVAMVAASVQPVPKSSFRQTSRQAIVARSERNRRMAAVRSRLDTGSGLQPRQATTSCGAYKTCTESSQSGSNYCTLRSYDLPGVADMGGIRTYSLEACVKGCEATSGCVGAFWRPDYSNVDITYSNCFFKSNSFSSSSFKKKIGASYTLTLLGSCCDFDSRLRASMKADACEDDGQKFVFPTCTGTRRTNSGAAVYPGIVPDGIADETSYRTDTQWSYESGGSIKAFNRATCLAACDTMPNCVGAEWWAGSADGNVSCYFKNKNYVNGGTGKTPGYRNRTTIDFKLKDTNCQSQVGKVPDIVSFYCCDDPVAAFPTCPSSTGDGTAYYARYDHKPNELFAYGPSKANQALVSSRADCNRRCFQDIGPACLGTVYTGPSVNNQNNCGFKTARVNSTNVFLTGNTLWGTTLIGGCSQYSSILSAGANSACCNNN